MKKIDLFSEDEPAEQIEFPIFVRNKACDTYYLYFEDGRYVTVSEKIGDGNMNQQMTNLHWGICRDKDVLFFINCMKRNIGLEYCTGEEFNEFMMKTQGKFEEFINTELKDKLFH